MKKLFIAMLLILLLTVNCFATGFTYTKRGLTGGATSDLDGIDGDDLANGYTAIVITSTSYYVYFLDATDGSAESSPDIIAPDSNPGTKRWLLQNSASEYTASVAEINRIADGITATAAEVNLVADGVNVNVVPELLASVDGLLATDTEINNVCDGVSSPIATELMDSVLGLTATDTEINWIADGILASAAEVNNVCNNVAVDVTDELALLDGMLATSTEINNVCDGINVDVVPELLASVNGLLATDTEINYVADNVTQAMATEFNLLSGLTASSAEINWVCDTVTQEMATELNLLSGLTATASEINFALDGILTTAAEINQVCTNSYQAFTTWDCPSIAAGSYQTTAIAWTGVSTYTQVLIAVPNEPDDLITTAWCTANVINIKRYNHTAGAIDPANGNYHILAFYTYSTTEIP